MFDSTEIGATGKDGHIHQADWTFSVNNDREEERGKNERKNPKKNKNKTSRDEDVDEDHNVLSC